MMKQLGVSASGRVIGGESGYTLVENENPMERSLSPGLPKEEPYLLSAVVVHLGAGVGGGHFVCYRKFHGQWWVCNDERCSPIDEDRVLSSHVYMLFYEKAKKTI
jgi:ubiquitin C-terminal hydrolase